MNPQLPPNAVDQLQNTINNSTDCNELRGMLIRVTHLLNDEVNKKKKLMRLLEEEFRRHRYSNGISLARIAIHWNDFISENEIDKY